MSNILPTPIGVDIDYGGASIQIVLMDNNSAPAEGMAHVRVVHASPDAPAVDVAVTGGPVLLENLSFGEASNYTPADAMTYDLEVRPTGTQEAALEIPGFSAEAGTDYTVFAMGLAGDGTLQAVPFVDAQTGMGGGDVDAAPGMPSTGAGRTAVTDTSSVAWTTVAAVAAVVAVVASGTIILGTRKLRA